MDIFEILSNYKKVLGRGCDKCITQEIEEKLKNITGNANIYNNIGFLLNVIKYIEENGRALDDNNMETQATNTNEINDMDNVLYKQWYEELQAENEALTKKVKSMESLMKKYNKCYVQQAKLKMGEKIAYKEQASVKEVNKLRKAGLSYDEIADKLGVSRSTVYRRIKETV